MSYSSCNVLPKGTSKKKVLEIVLLLGYHHQGSTSVDELGRIEHYYWVDLEEYRSWSGVELSIYEKNGSICIETRTPASRSYFDLDHQNKTIKLFRQLFGGTFETDEGRGRYFKPRSGPPKPAESGCNIAFHRFGSSLMSVQSYVMFREFKGTFPQKATGMGFLDDKNPWLVSNNLVLPYLVAILEDYYKSSFVAMLKSSDRKESFLRSGRLSSEHLLQISQGEKSIEDAVAESLPFQNISAVCKHFKALDKRIDFAAILRKPYPRRNQSLFSVLESVVSKRHDLIHKGLFDHSMDDKSLNHILYDIELSVIRCYRLLTDVYGWVYEKNWFIKVK